MNTYSRYTANVFLAKCEEEHKKGDIIIVTTKRGKENESVIHNLIYQKDGYYYYSITRADGFNLQERAKRKAEKHNDWSVNAEKRGMQHYEASQEGKDFLILAEPIKIGHHSEKRHRALIERNRKRMNNYISELKKAETHSKRAKYWAGRENEINLSIPESLEYYTYKLDEAKKHHKDLKDNPEKRSHSYSLTYANKKVKDLTKKVEIATKLWK